MSDQHWSTPEAHAYFRDLNSSGVAWEFLRRNPEYGADYAKPDVRAALDAGSPGPAQRWGLRFRG